MVRYHHSIEAVAEINFHRPGDIDVPFVEEHLAVVGRLAHDVTEMNISYFPRPTVPVDRFINVTARHLGDRALTEFDTVGGTRHEVQQALKAVRVVYEASRPTKHRHRGVRRVHGKPHPCSLCNREHFD